MQTAVECFNVNLESVMVKGLELHESWQSDLSIFNDHFSNTSPRSLYIIMPMKRGRCPWFFGQYRRFIKFIQLTSTCLLWSTQNSQHTGYTRRTVVTFQKDQRSCDVNQNKINATEGATKNVMFGGRCHWGSSSSDRMSERRLPKTFKNQFRHPKPATRTLLKAVRSRLAKIISDWNSVEWSVVPGYCGFCGEKRVEMKNLIVATFVIIALGSTIKCEARGWSVLIRKDPSTNNNLIYCSFLPRLLLPRLRALSTFSVSISIRL